MSMFRSYRPYEDAKGKANSYEEIYKERNVSNKEMHLLSNRLEEAKN